MENSFESILTDLQHFVEEPQPSVPRLITSGKNLANWADGRVKAISQILLNAVIIPRAEFELRLGRIQHQVESDITKGSVIKSLSYYFEDLDKMKEVVAQITQHYDSGLVASDLIKDMSGYAGANQERLGFVLVTIVESYIIQ